MPTKIKNAAFFVAVLLLLTLPVLAQRTNLRPAGNLFSPQQDIEMGRALAAEAEQNLTIVDQSNANAYIDALGHQLTAHAPGDRFPYQFKIIADDAINAYALPGGSIYVTSGLINAARNEPQLAGALAHEIGHVVLRHGTAEVSQAYADRLSNSTRSRISVNDAMSQLNIHFDRDSIPLRYTREEERQADAVATQVMSGTGFDPQQLVQFFQIVSNDRSNRTTDFFDNHPNVVNRAANVRAELQRLGDVQGKVRGDSPDFHSVQEKLLALNANSWRPAVSDRRTRTQAELPSTRMVVYRGRDIEFSYPDNWRVSDQGDSISIGPDNGFVSGSLAYGMTVATFDPQNNRSFGRNSLFGVPGAARDTASLSSATDQLLDQLRQSNPNMRVVRSNQRTRVDGSAAMVTLLSNDSPLGGTESDWLVTTLRPNGLLRYFIGVAPQREFGQYQNAFEQIVSSVRFMD